MKHEFVRTLVNLLTHSLADIENNWKFIGSFSLTPFIY